jgi:hypothetical protein
MAIFFESISLCLDNLLYDTLLEWRHVGGCVQVSYTLVTSYSADENASRVQVPWAMCRWKGNFLPLRPCACCHRRPSNNALLTAPLQVRDARLPLRIGPLISYSRSGGLKEYSIGRGANYGPADAAARVRVVVRGHLPCFARCLGCQHAQRSCDGTSSAHIRAHACSPPI